MSSALGPQSGSFSARLRQQAVMGEMPWEKMARNTGDIQAFFDANQSEIEKIDVEHRQRVAQLSPQQAQEHKSLLSKILKEEESDSVLGSPDRDAQLIDLYESAARSGDVLAAECDDFDKVLLHQEASYLRREALSRRMHLLQNQDGLLDEEAYDSQLMNLGAEQLILSGRQMQVDQQVQEQITQQMREQGASKTKAENYAEGYLLIANQGGMLFNFAAS